MKNTKVSRRYAEALLMVAMERNALDQYVKELEILEKHLLAEQEVVEAEVRSAVELTAKDFQDLQHRLTKAAGRKVKLRNIIDPGIIGGIVVRVGDTVLDGSVTHRLALMRKWMNSSEAKAPGLKKAFDATGAGKILANPEVSFQQKQEVLERIIKEGIGPVVAGFLYLILEKGRESLYLEIIRDFKFLANEARNMVTAQVHSAVELSAEDIRALEGRLSGVTGKNVRVEAKIDRSLIGGLVIRIGDAVIDGSVRKKLSLLKKGLSSGSLKE